MIRPLAAHVALGEAIELGVNERRELFESFLLAVAPGFQKLGKFVAQGVEIYHIKQFSRRFSRINADLIRIHPRSSVAKFTLKQNLRKHHHPFKPDMGRRILTVARRKVVDEMEPCVAGCAGMSAGATCNTAHDGV